MMLLEAITLVKRTLQRSLMRQSELHIRPLCDGRHAEQQIHGAVVLPHGTGEDCKKFKYSQKGVKLDECAGSRR